jgi:WD40 repeat protein
MAPQIVVTYNSDSKTFFSGTSTGDIYEWAGNTCIKSAKVHQGSVRGLQWAGGFLLSSGSKDNLLKVSKGYEVVKTFDI